MPNQTEIHGIPLATEGHMPLQQTVEQGFKKVDKIVPPPFVNADIGKVLTLVDDGDGNAVMSWETPAA